MRSRQLGELLGGGEPTPGGASAIRGPPVVSFLAPFLVGRVPQLK